MDLRGLAALAVKMIGMLDPEAEGKASGLGRASSAITEVRSVDENIEPPAHTAVSTHRLDDPLDLYGLSRLLHRRGEGSRARAVCESALLAGLPGDVERMARRDLALFAKRERDYARANSFWHALCDSRGPGAQNKITSNVSKGDACKALETSIEAAEQLAIYYEHRAKQPHRAAELIRSAAVQLRSAQRSGTIAADRVRKIEVRLERRLTRLTRRGAKTVLHGLESTEQSVRE
jgi:hypothetical protein